MAEREAARVDGAATSSSRRPRVGPWGWASAHPGCRPCRRRPRRRQSRAVTGPLQQDLDQVAVGLSPGAALCLRCSRLRERVASFLNGAGLASLAVPKWPNPPFTASPSSCRRVGVARVVTAPSLFSEPRFPGRSVQPASACRSPSARPRPRAPVPPGRAPEVDREAPLREVAEHDQLEASVSVLKFATSRGPSPNHRLLHAKVLVSGGWASACASGRRASS